MIQAVLNVVIPIVHWIWQRASLGAVVVLLRDDEVLLVRSDYRKGWHLPGGHLNPGESFESAVRREAVEEVGMELTNLELLEIVGGTTQEIIATTYSALYRSARFRQVKQVAPNWEVRETRWFRTSELPIEMNDFVGHCIERAIRNRPCAE